ncbi:MAG: glutamine--fructose-6-phosphate transaminase (isomerizing) [Elusimicrobia bacterium]|nr:glutamine--fructose-6-phosphate transaminase (isomerizing) [Elusimicrobiota bacterium]
MCGIVGYIGSREAGEVLLQGLKRLEYRGYDSAGLAVLANGQVQLRRSVGKLSALAAVLERQPVTGHVGLGHTRWATHGRPSEENAHPHASCHGEIIVVHNGIIENYPALKQTLLADGHRFQSETDTEVLAHLIEKYFQGDLLSAVRQALAHVQGSYALGVIARDDPHRVVAARQDCPLVVGFGSGEFFLASDVPPLLPYTRRMTFLEDGEIAVLTPEGVQLWDAQGRSVDRSPLEIAWDRRLAEKGGFKHFMLKEIFEQDRAIQDTLRGRFTSHPWRVQLDEAGLDVETAQRLQQVIIVACGTSFHAGLIGRILCETWGRLPVTAEIASEFRYRSPFLDDRTLLVVVTQSGETADTLAALREGKRRGARCLAICNVVGSSATREAHAVLYTHCGPEIGVASTKAFSGQLTTLTLLALYLGQARGTLTESDAEIILQALVRIPKMVRLVLERHPAIEAIARQFAKRSHFLYLGRHVNYPIALEGALKLKEISYIHAEGSPAGEMKHGPIALIDETMPVLMLATRSSVYEKLLSNVQEVRARGGVVIAVATDGDERIAAEAQHVLWVPEVMEWLSPIVNVIPLQLLAYHIAVLRGCDVDQPRNLAKSVTVE